jgi:hypothetical protein
MREEWTRPEVEEFDIAERTQLGEGFQDDGITNGFVAGGDPDGGDGGGGAAPSS